MSTKEHKENLKFENIKRKKKGKLNSERPETI